nr:hypothetical protein [Kibdelosporangium sp. MJ126-NF4]CEL16430.1 Protein-export membrane protein SecD (TC 3.A.5.1.1) [Kibdelosporangium sp. MJ126-NF4]CTQ90382.1 Protein-export membrane protein SecD (TC 3.A.5.1.1) [Kibdelosporangium sp. MJ126-NF4]
MRGINGLVAIVVALSAGCTTVVGTPVPPTVSSAPAKPVEVRVVVDASPEIRLRDRAGEEYALGPVEMKLERFAKAFVQANPHGVDFVINLELPGDLATRFGELTQANLNKRLAMVVDGTVVFAPQIIGPIPGGQVQVQHRFTKQEATDLLDAIGGERR